MLYSMEKSNFGEKNIMMSSIVVSYPLGHTFFILWFTDPPTLFFDEMEKK